MSIKVTDLPGGVEDVHMKMFVLFERRLSRHYSSKVKFCVSCFYNCLDLKGYYTDEIVNKMISTASSLCISTILQQLQEGLQMYYLKCPHFGMSILKIAQHLTQIICSSAFTVDCFTLVVWITISIFDLTLQKKKKQTTKMTSIQISHIRQKVLKR